MQNISNQEFGGERPLYNQHGLHIDHVTIHLGESSIKEGSDIEAEHCTFEGKYVFWECRHFKVSHSLFRESARSSLWYSEDVTMTDTVVEAPKMFRRMKGIHLSNVQLPNAAETLWDCSDIVMHDVTIANADYLMMHARNVSIERYRQDGNYSFQYARNVEIHHALINSKDSFWEAEDVSIFDSEINGEYLGWYSKRLRLVRCHITGTQPLCYCEDLILEDCTFGDDADLALEYSTVQATIRGHVISIKNPTSGSIRVESCGEVIIDDNQKSPADCSIQVGSF